MIGIIEKRLIQIALVLVVSLSGCSTSNNPSFEQANTTISRSDCMTLQDVENINKNVIGDQIAHIKGKNAIIFIVLDPYWSVPDFDNVPYRHPEDMAITRNTFNELVKQDIDEVVAWKFHRFGLGAAIALNNGCVFSKYGEPDKVDKLIAMHKAFQLIVNIGLDSLSVRESIKNILQTTHYGSTNERVDKIISKVRPFIGQ